MIDSSNDPKPNAASSPAEPRQTVAGDYYEFGPFRLDLSSRALYRGDEFIALTPKAFDTLRVLVEEAGRLVTKDELLQRVWPDAFVEEGSIANNVSALRKVLNPYFAGDGPIATVSRRGYRFTAPVQLRNAKAQITVLADTIFTVSPEGLAEAEHSARLTPEKELTDDTVTADTVAAQADRISTMARALAIAAGVILIAGAIGIPMSMRVNTATPSEARSMRRAVALVSMKNLSGQTEHAWFATALSEAINAELIAGGQLRIISGAAVKEMLQDHAPQPGVAMSRKQLDEVGRSLGCDLVLSGTYLHAGGQVRLNLRLDDIASGNAVATVVAERPEEKLLDLVEVASRELRTRLGLMPPLPGQGAAVRAALSSNPDALRFYFIGLDALRNHEINRSLELLTQAVDEDPGFALAYSAMSTSWRVLGQDEQSEQAAKKAFDLADRLGREDQLLVQGAYYAVMNEPGKAREKFQALWNFFPDDIAYGLRLTHQQLLGGDLAEARLTIDQMRALPPPADSDARIDVVESDWLLRKAQYADAIRVAGEGVEKATRRKSTQMTAILRMTQGRSATRLGDFTAAGRYIADAQQLYQGLDDQGGIAEAVLADAVLLLTSGQPQQAEQRVEAALQAAVKLNHSRLLVEIRIRRSQIALANGKLALAKSDAEASLASARALGHRAAIARALTALGSAVARQGDSQAARAHFDEAERLGREIGEPSIVASAAAGLADLEQRRVAVADSIER